MKRLLSLVVFAAVLVTACTGPWSSPPTTQPPTPAPTISLATLAAEILDSVTKHPRLGASAKLHTQDAYTPASDAGYVSWVVATADTGYGLSVKAEGCDDGFVSVLPFTSNQQVRVELRCVQPKPPTPPAPPTPQHPDPLVGLLRIEGGCFRDDTGCVNPLYAHAGDFFSKYLRDRTFIQQQLDVLASTGYHGLRVWSTLGCGTSTLCPPTERRNGGDYEPYWRGREVGPGLTPNYWGELEAFFREVAARKLRLVWSQGDVAQLGDRRAYMERLVALEAHIGTRVVDWVDCGNEAWQTGEPDPVRLAACVGYYKSAGGKALLTLSSPPGEIKSELDAFSIPPADAYDVHSYRGGRWYDKHRHVFSIPYEGKPEKRFGINSEPPGNGELVSVTEAKHELDDEAMCGFAAMHPIARMAYVWFAGEGVKVARGLQGEAGFRCTPGVYALLPKDLALFGPMHHSGDSWRGTRIMATQHEARVDGRIAADGRFVYSLYGPSAAYSFPVERGFTGRLCDPNTLNCTDVTFRAGETFNVTWSRGRVLVGRLQ